MDLIAEPYAGTMWTPEHAPAIQPSDPIVPHVSPALAVYLAGVDYHQTALMYGGPPCIPLTVGKHEVGQTSVAIEKRIIVPHYCTHCRVYYSASGQGTLYIKESTETFAAAYPITGNPAAAFDQRQRLRGSVTYDPPASAVNRALRMSSGNDPPYEVDLTIYYAPAAGATCEVYSIHLRPFRLTAAL